jgi:hypothetical protein
MFATDPKLRETGPLPPDLLAYRQEMVRSRGLGLDADEERDFCHRLWDISRFRFRMDRGTGELIKRTDGSAAVDIDYCVAGYPISGQSEGLLCGVDDLLLVMGKANPGTWIQCTGTLPADCKPFRRRQQRTDLAPTPHVEDEFHGSNCCGLNAVANLVHVPEEKYATLRLELENQNLR